ncbi:MAG: hypothetical protein ACRCRZ_00540 [Metamycoplasmataceae bacterium]
MENNNLNSKAKSWIKPLYTFFVIAIPAFFIWFFLSNDFGLFNNLLNFGYAFLIAIGFILISTILTYVVYYFKLVDIFVFSFSLPVAIALMTIYLSSYINNFQYAITIRAILVLIVSFSVVPINMIIIKLNIKQIAKQRIKDKK